MYYKPRIDKEILAQYSEGLIGTSACLAGEVARHIMAGRDEGGGGVDRLVQEHLRAGRFLSRDRRSRHSAAEDGRSTELLKYAKQFGLKIVATNDVHYVRKEHAAAHDVLLCIQTGAKIADENRMRYHGPEFYLKTQEEMAALFREVPESLDADAGDRGEVRPEDRAGEEQVPGLRRAGGRDARGLSATALLRGPGDAASRTRTRNPSCASGSTSSWMS